MGRKSLRDEVMMTGVINLSWTTVSRAFNSSKFTEAEKVKMAMEIVKKTCPQQVEHSGDLNVVLSSALKESRARAFETNVN